MLSGKKGPGGFSSKRNMRLVQKREDGLNHSGLCLHVLWSWMLYSAAGYGAPTAPENNVYFSFLSRWCLAGCWCGDSRRLRASAVAPEMTCVRCDGDLSAVSVAGERAGWLSMRGSLPAASRTRMSATRAFTKKKKKKSACWGTHVTFQAFFTTVSLHARLIHRSSQRQLRRKWTH